MAILRNVAKTDTLEIQRQKINLIASDLFTVQTSVGAGAFSMNDGSYTAPALYFTSQNDLGIFKGGTNTLSFASNNTTIAALSDTKVAFFKKIGIQKNAIGSTVPATVITITNAGSNYVAGTYSAIPLTGGGGTGATANITISGFGGSVTNQGSGYTPGTYTNVALTGGSGSGATATIVIPTITGTIIGGSGYVNGTYSNVPLTGGSGTGAQATVQVSGGVVVSVVLTNDGNKAYVNGNILSASNTNLGGSGSGFTFTVTNYPYKIIASNITFTSYGTGYVSGNTLSVSAANVGGTGSGFAYTISSVGTLSSASIVDGGSSYAVGDVLSFNANDLAAADTYAVTVANTQLLVFGSTLPTTGFTVGGTVTIGATTKTILKRFTSGSNITAVIVSTASGTFSAPDGQTATSGGGTATVQSNTVANQYFFDLNDGNGVQLTPNITLLKNKTYIFSSSDFVSHPFLFSTTADGVHGGGTQYTGSEVTVGQTTVSIKPNASTPTTLYIYCANHPNMAGYDGREMVVTIGSAYVAPGSGAQITVNSIVTDDTFSASLSGAVTSTSLSTATIATTSTITAGGAVSSTSTGTFAGVISSKNLSISGVSELQDSVTARKNFTVAPVYTAATGSITCSTNSTSVVGTSTSFLTDLAEGYQLYDSNNNLIGVVSGISTNTLLTLLEVAKVDVSLASYKYAKDWNIFSDNITGFTGIKKVKPLYNLDIGGTFRSSGNSIVAEDIGSKLVVGDRALLLNLGSTDKLYVQGNIISGGKVIADSTASITSPTLTFANNLKVGLLSNSTNKYLSVTGTSGELVRYESTNIGFYRNASFTHSTISNFLILKGSGYTNGAYTNVALSGGTGSGLLANLTVAFDANITTPGTGYTNGTYTNVPLTGGSGTGAVATIKISTGEVYAATLTSGGSGYTSAPTVSFSQNAGGTGATAVANLASSGSVKTIGVNAGGSNYATAPTVVIGNIWTSANTVNVGQQYFYGNNLYTVTVAGVTGSTAPTHTSGSVVNGTATLTYAGAKATATAVVGTTVGVDLGTIISVNVNTNGSGYTTTPNISFTGGGGAGATATATLQFAVASLTITNGGSGYTSAPSISFTGGNGTGANFTSLVTSSGVSSVIITNGGSGYTLGNTLGFSHTSLLDANSNPSTAPSVAAVLTVSSLGAVTVVDVTDQGNGYLVDDILTMPSGVNGLTNGSGFSYTIKALTNEETITVNKKLGKITAKSINTTSDGILIDNNMLIDGTTLSSTQNEDIFITPGSSSKLLSVSGTGGVKLPVGNSTNRPSATTAGIIRYNTQTSQYEGSNGVNFISLGGVRDVDGNTYIIAEETVGANDNTLYFFNDGYNSARFKRTEVELVTANKLSVRDTDGKFLWKPSTTYLLNSYVYYGDNIYQVTIAGTTGTVAPTHTSGSVVNGTATLTYYSNSYGSLEIRGNEIKLGTRVNIDDKLNIYTYDTNNLIFETSLDTAKIAFGNNLGVPDTLVCFDGSSGALKINRNYDTAGAEDTISIVDKTLKFFELTDVKYETSSTLLVKGTSNIGTSTVYNPTVHISAKVIVTAHNLTTGDKQMIEYNVIHKGTDIFAIQYGNTVTNGDLFVGTFDFDVSNNIRFTATLASSVANGNNVRVVVTKTQIKH